MRAASADTGLTRSARYVAAFSPPAAIDAIA
jgi:hypothetical protein